jgi:hypothetical protein
VPAGLVTQRSLTANARVVNQFPRNSPPNWSSALSGCGAYGRITDPALRMIRRGRTAIMAVVERTNRSLLLGTKI